MPLFKRGSAFLPGQNRGVHLTSILSKIVERVIGQPLITFLEQKGLGDAQWAFRKRSSARDMVTIYVAKWVLIICQGRRVGLYLSDISGAFDKISRTLLIGELSQIGLPSSFFDFLNSYLSTREGVVRVEGAISDAMALANGVSRDGSRTVPMERFFCRCGDRSPIWQPTCEAVCGRLIGHDLGRSECV